jgi:hypothetical protein
MAVDIQLRTDGYANPSNPTSSQPGGATTYFADVLADLQTLKDAAESGTFASLTVTGNMTVGGNLEVDGTIQHDGGTLTTTDKNILINKGGTTAGAVGSGISIEGDAAAEVGYFKTGAADNTVWTIKAPGNAGVMTLDINATKTWTVGGALNVSADSAINQDVGSAASPVWVSPTVTTLLIGNGAVGAPAVKIGGGTKGFYHVSDSQLGVSIAGSLSTLFVDGGIQTDLLRARVEPLTYGAGVTGVTVGDGRNYVTTLTLTAVAVGNTGGAANLAFGVLIATLPAGVQALNYTYVSIALNTATVAVQTDTPDLAIGSILASGAVATLGGTAGFNDLANVTTMADVNGTANVVALFPTVGSGAEADNPLFIMSGDAKTLHLNVADGWAAAADITATGTITFSWTKLA